MASSRTILFIGSLLTALAAVSVMVYVGVERYGEIEPSVRRRWEEEGKALLNRVSAEVKREWLTLETEALEEAAWRFDSGRKGGTETRAGEGGNVPGKPAAPPSLVSGSFRLDRGYAPVHPPDWGEAWSSFTEVGPDDRAGEERFTRGERLEFRDGQTEKAIALFRSVSTNQFGVTLRNKARFASGGAAFKIGKYKEASRFYRMILADPVPAGIAPWIRAVSWFRVGECLVRSGDRSGARSRFQLLLEALSTKGEAAPLFGLNLENRRFLAEKTLRKLADLASNEEETGARKRLEARWRERLGEGSLLEALRVWVIPDLQRSVGETSPRRTRAAFEKQWVLSVVEKRDDGWTGVFLDGARLLETLGPSETTTDSPFAVTLHGPDTDPWAGKPLAGLTPFPELDGIELAVRLRHPDARQGEIVRRKALLMGLLSLAGVVLLAGTVLVLRRLKKEMDLSRLKSDFLAGVSHDFRTPLTIIRSSAETLQLGRVSDPEKTARYLDVILKETVRLDRYVGNVLEAARLELGRERRPFSPLDLEVLVREVEEARRLYLEEEGFRFEVESETGLPPVRADAEALRSALFNLIENAVKYSEGEKEILLRAFRRDEAVVVSMADRGVGVDAEEKKKIFERFYRSGGTASSAKGLGLGLALVLEAAKAHGGRVEVEAREGGGTVFSMILPVSGQES